MNEDEQFDEFGGPMPTEATESGQLAPVVPAAPVAQFAHIFPLSGVIERPYSSAKLTGLKALAFILRVSQVSDFSGKKDAGAVLPTQDVVIFRKEVTDEETGEVRDATVVTLIAPDGTTMSTTGEWVLDGLRQLVAIYKEPPWVPALPLRLKPHRTNRGREMLILDLAE